MAKGKKNKSKKATPSRKKKKMAMRGPPTGHAGFAMQVCSVTNPFCPEAKGARWPDNSWTKSVGLPFESSGQLATDANGNTAVLFGPTLNSSYVLGTVTLPNAAYTTWGMTPGYTALTGVARWRLTSYGVKISCISSPMTTTGRVRVRLLSPMTGTALTSIDIGTALADVQLDEPLARLIDRDLYINAAPLGDSARLFTADVPTPLTVANWVNPGWQVIQIAVHGNTASTTSLAYTLYYNYEVVFDDSTTNQMFATAPPMDSLAVREASASVFQRVGNFVEGAAAKVDALFQSKAAKYFGGAVAGYLGGPGVGASAYTALANYPAPGRNSRAIMVD